MTGEVILSGQLVINDSESERSDTIFSEEVPIMMWLSQLFGEDRRSAPAACGQLTLISGPSVPT